MMAKKDKNAVGSASVDFLNYSGYVTLAEHWLRMEEVATKKMNSGQGEKDFLDSKIKVYLRFMFRVVFLLMLTYSFSDFCLCIRHLAPQNYLSPSHDAQPSGLYHDHDFKAIFFRSCP